MIRALLSLPFSILALGLNTLAMKINHVAEVIGGFDCMCDCAWPK